MNYLSERSQCVQFDGLSSEWLNITNGVPQGSVLGPLLFMMWMEQLYIFYADDTVMYCAGPLRRLLLNCRQFFILFRLNSLSFLQWNLILIQNDIQNLAY